MTIDQHSAKLLLDYEAQLEGMKAENQRKHFLGQIPTYGPDDFQNLSNRYTEYLHRF